ncbi:hypothetical protein N7450_009149 [Penicillium hetheringtonii]|uniref:Uncharacterized protein n=1 Tax=Penicillium hetheringtonii TaxID=911720 RepID=A0AAD6GN66_9EURO|nr:hypothetical protein N7450_009149 [Penicillium hetheringtonii]
MDFAGIANRIPSSGHYGFEQVRIPLSIQEGQFSTSFLVTSQIGIMMNESSALRWKLNAMGGNRSRGRWAQKGVFPAA